MWVSRRPTVLSTPERHIAQLRIVHRVDETQPANLSLLQKNAQASHARLASAVRLEEYFHQLSNQHPDVAVRDQWEHSRRLLAQAVETYTADSSCLVEPRDSHPALPETPCLRPPVAMLVMPSSVVVPLESPAKRNDS
jgi:hypothetical protein